VAGLRDSEAAEAVARRLRALAADMREQPCGGGCGVTVVDAFLAAAHALESATVPPPRHQVLALVQVLTAGFAMMTAETLEAPAPANDFA
jgi:glutathione S-transferase